MSQKYRIYINDNSLLIAKKVPADIEKVQHLDIQNFDFLTFLKNLKKGKAKHYFLASNDPETDFKKIKKSCTIVKAAGGLVENSKKEYLFIFRNKKWDLPKGKVEKGEKIKKAGIREVEEECGIEIDSTEKRLCKTYHIYAWDEKLILKRTSWFKMFVNGKPKLVPQKEEGITTAEWVSKNKIKTKTENTYPLILDVLKAGKIL